MTAGIDLNRVGRGFDNPPLEAQALFRRILEAMARPGRVQDLSTAPMPPAGLGRAAAGVALTLIDFETPVWLQPCLRGGDAEAWLRFHCGCPMTEQPAAAAFAIIAEPASMPLLTTFSPGEDKYPDRSTTVVVEARSLDDGPAITIAGPGIRTPLGLCVSGLPGDFWRQFEENGRSFQLGVDVLLAADAKLIGLPRTVRVGRPEQAAPQSEEDRWRT